MSPAVPIRSSNNLIARRDIRLVDWSYMHANKWTKDSRNLLENHKPILALLSCTKSTFAARRSIMQLEIEDKNDCGAD